MSEVPSLLAIMSPQASVKMDYHIRRLFLNFVVVSFHLLICIIIWGMNLIVLKRYARLLLFLCGANFENILVGVFFFF